MTDQTFPEMQANPPPLLLSADDHERLIELAQAAVARYPADDARLLLDELHRADVVPPDWVPAGVVAMNSYVEFRDERTRTVRHVQIVYPYQANISKGRISVLSLIGAALIGLAEGQSIVCRTQDGRPRRLTVLHVSREPIGGGPNAA